jgi:hypothetical protein
MRHASLGALLRGFMLRVSFLALLCFATVAVADPVREVLPDTVVPTHYDLALY